MSKQEPTFQSQSVSDYQRVTFREFVNITKWNIGLIFKLYPVNASLFLVSSSVSKLTDLVYAYIYAWIIDFLINLQKAGGKSLKDIIPVLLILIGYNIAETTISFVRGYSQIYLRTGVRPLVRQIFTLKLKRLGIQTLEQPDVNDKIYRSRDYLGEIVPYYFSVMDLLSEFVRFVFAAVLVFKVQPLFGLLIILFYAPYVFFDKKMRVKAYKFDYETTEDSRISNDSIADIQYVRTLNEISIINAYGFFEKKYMDFQTWAIKTRIGISLQWRAVSHSFGFLRDLVLYASYAAFFLDVLKDKLTIGQLTFGVRSINSFNSSISYVTQILNDLMESSLRFKDMYRLFDMPPIVEDGTVEFPLLESGPSIELQNVKFKYPNAKKFVFEDLNLNIKAGEKVAIVGHNGAGKTTLVRLIARFYKADGGQILINGLDLNSLRIDSLYENMGVLWQDFNTHPQLTAEENIYVGRTSVPFDEQRIIAAAEAADAKDFIEKYPKGFKQILSEKIKGGVRPYTGQWQKLAIARFFYRNAPLIIFDEPTASIDAVSEYNIFKRIYDFFKGKTVIIISHRFSTVRNADRIIVLDDGQIIEEGSHEELMRLGGKYAEAFKLQAEGYKEDISPPLSNPIV